MEQKNFMYEFPRTVNWRLHLHLQHCASLFVAQFDKLIKPILKQYGLDDDEHIRKYMAAEDMRPIYEDILKINGLAHLVNYFKSTGVDFWKRFRDTTRCDAGANPEDEGFAFIGMPLTDSLDERGRRIRKIVLQSLNVVDGVISVDKKVLEDEAVVTPDERQRRAYDLAARFLSEIRKIGLGNKRISDFFTYDSNRLVVNAKGILGII